MSGEKYLNREGTQHLVEVVLEAIPVSLPADGGNADTVGGYTPEQLIQSNPNLLDNPNFRINDSHAVSMWSPRSAATHITADSDGLRIAGNSIIGTVIACNQRLKNPEDTLGKTVTISCNVTENNNSGASLFVGLYSADVVTAVSSAIGYINIPAGQIGYYSMALSVPETALDTYHGINFSIRGYGVGQVDAKVEWVKLENGEVATPFIPPDPTVEALKCLPGETLEQKVFYGNGIWNDAPSNPNLLCNPNFKINQRGKSVYDSGYTVDRWKIYANNAQITVFDSDIKVESVADNGVATIYQELDNVEEFAGKTLTFSVCVTEVMSLASGIMIGTVRNGSVTANSSLTKITQPGVHSVHFLIPNDIISIRVYLRGADTRDDTDIVGGYTIYKWAKLEIGSVATPFVPPDPALELLKCQRYYLRIGDTYEPLCMVTMHTSSTGSGVIPFPVAMRVAPTTALKGTIYGWQYNAFGTNGVKFGAINSATGNKYGCFIQIKPDEPITSEYYGKTFALQFRDNNSYLEFSADL